MHPLALPCLVLCGINLTAAAFHLVLYARRHQVRESLPFALLCLSLAAYDLFCAGLYSSGSLDEGIAWQRAQLLSLGLVSVFLIWFLGLLTAGRLDGIVRFFIAAFVVLFAATLAFDGPGLTLSTTTPSIKTVHWGGRILVTYHESEVGILHALGMLLSYVAYAYLFRGLYRAHRARPRAHIGVVMAGQVVYFLGLLNDGLVGTGAYVFVYVSEYAYLVVVLTMGYALLSSFVDLHVEVEQARLTLEERVREALVDVKMLRGLIPICAACKKVRDDRGFWNQLETYIGQHSDATFSHGICPDCMRRLYPEYAERALRRGTEGSTGQS
jgi:hypothetical protein